MLPPDQIEKLVDKVVERLQRASSLPQAGAGADGAGRGFEVQPMRAPVYSAACSVDSPISHASGISATAASTKSTTFPGCARTSTRSVSGASASEAQRSLRATRLA